LLGESGNGLKSFSPEEQVNSVFTVFCRLNICFWLIGCWDRREGLYLTKGLFWLNNGTIMSDMSEDFTDDEQFGQKSLMELAKSLFQGKNVLLFAGMALLLIGLVAVMAVSSSSSEDIEFITENDMESNKKTIFVDVAGAVERPGVYELDSKARINDALIAAGGLAENADRAFVSKSINLASVVKDGAKIYIKEIGNQQPATSNQMPDSRSQTSEVRGLSTNQEKININTASQSELEKLPGVGPATAEKIISYRQNNPFSSIEDLMKVPGIGEKTFEKMKEMISVY